MPGSFPVMKNQVDYNAGELKETSNPLDLAISGEGFFALINANGDKVYTRDGQFYSNSEGTLVNSMGHEFSDEGGNAIALTPGQPDPLIDEEGQIFQGEQLVGNLGVFVFEDPLTQLQKVGGGFISKDEGFEPENAQPENFKVLQGFLESSNVSAIEEMIGLIEVSRAHEANQKMIQSFDENIGKAIGALGQTS